MLNKRKSVQPLILKYVANIFEKDYSHNFVFPHYVKIFYYDANHEEKELDLKVVKTSVDFVTENEVIIEVHYMPLDNYELDTFNLVAKYKERIFDDNFTILNIENINIKFVE